MRGKRNCESKCERGTEREQMGKEWWLPRKSYKSEGRAACSIWIWNNFIFEDPSY